MEYCNFPSSLIWEEEGGDGESNHNTLPFLPALSILCASLLIPGEPTPALRDLSDQDAVPWTLSMHSYPPPAFGLYDLSESSLK